MIKNISYSGIVMSETPSHQSELCREIGKTPQIISSGEVSR